MADFATHQKEVTSPQQQQQHQFVSCACPTGCVVGEAIDASAPDDAISVQCTNAQCTARMVHNVCATGWQFNRTSSAMDKCARCHVGTLAIAGGRMHLSAGKSFSQRAEIGQYRAGAFADSRPRTMSMDSHFGRRHNGRRAHTGSQSTGGSHSYFDEPHVRQYGSIFEHRSDFRSLLEALPAHKLNGFHVKLEDDCPQGNDDVRILVLRTLGALDCRHMQCCVCGRACAVYDRYPLIDGTFFVSPLNQSGRGVPLRFEQRSSFLLALCVHCMEHGASYQCVHCRSTLWLPVGCLVIGGLYTYDLLSCRPCCQRRCSHCNALLPMASATGNDGGSGDSSVWRGQTSYFSYYSLMHVCAACGARDYHHLRRAPAELAHVACATPPSISHAGPASPSRSSSSGVSSDDWCHTAKAHSHATTAAMG